MYSLKFIYNNKGNDMKPYPSQLEVLFDKYSSDSNDKREKVMTHYEFFLAIDEYIRKAVPLTNEITDEQLKRSRELCLLATGHEPSEYYDAKEWADYNRLMEAVDSINCMCTKEWNMIAIVILPESIELRKMECKNVYTDVLLKETYNNTDNPTLKDALQKILIRYYKYIRKGKI